MPVGRDSVAPVTGNSMQDKLDDLQKRREEAYHAGSPRSVERQHAKGKLLARERIEYLLDDGLVQRARPARPPPRARRPGSRSGPTPTA